jgi:hypothetical protein
VKSTTVDDSEIEAEKIVKKIVAAMEEQLDKGRKFEAGAFADWRKKLKAKVLEKVKKPKEFIWDNDEPKVLKVAGDMTKIAQFLAHEDKVIDGARLGAAFEACKFHKRCNPKALVNFFGSWCDF